jgi:uncharacterized protein (DUF4415 family)
MSILTALRARVPAKAYTLAKAGAAMAVVGWGIALLQQVLEDTSAELDEVMAQIERAEQNLTQIGRTGAEMHQRVWSQAFEAGRYAGKADARAQAEVRIDADVVDAVIVEPETLADLLTPPGRES